MATAVQGEMTASPRPQLWRVRDRATFDALRRTGRRARSGGISVTWLAPAHAGAGSPPRVAWAIGRRTGGAVLRNRIRRRLRAGLVDLQARGQVPDGTYLLGADAHVAALPWAELLDALRDAVAGATGGGR